jgi:hypothetical protein
LNSKLEPKIRWIISIFFVRAAFVKGLSLVAKTGRMIGAAIAALTLRPIPVAPPVFFLNESLSLIRD